MNLILNIISPLLLVSLLAFCILIWINRKTIFNCFKKVKNKTWILLLLIILTSLLLRIFVVAHIHNLYYDEPGYLDISKHIANEGKNCLCLYNVDGKCLVCNSSLKSVGFVTILAFFIKIFGLSANTAFNLTAFIGAASIGLMFLFTYLLFQKESIALLSALILAFNPLHLRWSGSASSEIVSLFFILLTLTCLLLYVKSKIPILISSLLALSLTLSIREENIAVLPFFLLPFLTIKEYRKRFLPSITLILLVAIPSLIGLYFSAYGKRLSPVIGYTFWKQGSLLSIAFLKQYFLTNMKFFLNTEYTPLLAIVLTFLGFILLLKDKKMLALTLFSGAIILPLIFSAYVGQELTGIEVRRYIPSLIPIAVFSGYAVASLEKKSLLKNVKITLVLSLLVLASLITYIPYLKSKDSPYATAQQDYEFAINSISKIPEDCLIITQEPYIFDLHDRSAVSIHLTGLYFNNECMYYYEGESCYTLGMYELCNKVLETFDLETYSSNGRHTFYKIMNKEVLLNFG